MYGPWVSVLEHVHGDIFIVCSGKRFTRNNKEMLESFVHSYGIT